MFMRRCKIGETEVCAKEIAAGLKERPFSKFATVVGLSGELGSGKTAFVKALALALGITEEVVSPTFVIERIYKLSPGGTFRHLVHIDAYRLESEEELLSLGWEELAADHDNLILIEWPERVKKIIPTDAMNISFKFIDEETREITWK